MSSLFANKVETNVCLVSMKLFIIRTILCASVPNLYHVYNNNLFIRYSYLLATFLQAALSRYFSHTTIRQIFTTAIFKPQLYTRIIEFLLTLSSLS